MMEALHAFFKQVPMAALFASLAIGYLIGKIKIGKFQLGGMTGTLLAAVAIGQIGVPVDPVVKQMMFALFIFTTGYVCGPQFFVNLNRKTLNQLHLALFSGIVVFVVIWGLARLMDFDNCMPSSLSMSLSERNRWCGATSTVTLGYLWGIVSSFLVDAWAICTFLFIPTARSMACCCIS